MLILQGLCGWDIWKDTHLSIAEVLKPHYLAGRAKNFMFWACFRGMRKTGNGEAVSVLVWFSLSGFYCCLYPLSSIKASVIV